MKPILYDKLKTTFTIDYIGILTDAISCYVEEGRNDQYELEMTYPVDGVYYQSIQQDMIIKAKPNNLDNPQPFRIYKIEKSGNGIITAWARHIVYDLSKVTVEPFTSSGTIADAIQGMIDHSIPSCGFVFDTEKTTAGNYKVSVPTSFRALMGGVRGSLLDVFGTGEYHYNEYDIDLLLNRGQDRGVVIRYGISMVDMKQEEECDKVYTAVYPFWHSGSEYVQLDERIISVGQYPFSRVMPLDLSSDFQNPPTQAQLRTKAQQYINEHDIGVPSVSLDVNFAGTEEEQEINLCDIVSIEFEKIGIRSSAKCISLKYDSIAERVVSVKLGNYKNTFIDTIANQMKGITQDAVLDPTEIEESITHLAHTNEGYVIIHSSTNTDHYDEILILSDTDKPNLAQQLWRWNSGGLGHSNNGYSGTFETAITKDGRIVASAVKTGTLTAIQINNSNSPFYVSPEGVMKAISGYIGSKTTGFHITANEIYNSNIRLFSKGVAIKNYSNGTEMGYCGKINELLFVEPVIVTEQDGNTYRIYYENQIVDALTISDPGIGLVASKNSIYTMWGYWNETSSANALIMKYSTHKDPELYDSSGNFVGYILYRKSEEGDYTFVDYTIESAISVYKNINMNNNLLLVTPDKTRGMYRSNAYPVQDDHGGRLEQIHQTYVKGHRLYQYVIQIQTTGFGVVRYRRVWSDSEIGGYGDFII